jgi:FMN-dependent NADH-azoreductase
MSTSHPPVRLLRLDASARHAGSHSRALADHFETLFTANHPAALVQRRDLATNPVPHLTEETVTGFFTPPEQHTESLRAATATSDTLIAELKATDVLIISTPIYNFSVPSVLKAWIDQIMRFGHTFGHDGKNFTGLVPGKRAYLVAAYGVTGYLNGGPFATADHLVPLLKTALGFIGITQIEVIAVEGASGDPTAFAAQLDQARTTIASLAAR